MTGKEFIFHRITGAIKETTDAVKILQSKKCFEDKQFEEALKDLQEIEDRLFNVASSYPWVKE